MWPTLTLLVGVAAAAAGGELFVRGIVGAAARLRVAPGVVATTVAAFATSSPELSVAANAAAAGDPEIGLGDALGSNVVNIGFVLGLALLIRPLATRQANVARDVTASMAAPVLVLLLLMDGALSRRDAVVLLLVFAAWVTATIRTSVRQRPRAAGARQVAAGRTGRVVRDLVLGLGLLVVAGRLVVSAAQGFGQLLGWDEFTVGAVLVAVATSTPELATVVASRLRRHDDISVGTLLGSNVFNGLLVVGVAASVHPIRVSAPDLWVTVLAGLATLLLLLPGRSSPWSARRGAALLTTYLGYVVLLLGLDRGLV